MGWGTGGREVYFKKGTSIAQRSLGRGGGGGSEEKKKGEGARRLSPCQFLQAELGEGRRSHRELLVYIK